MLIIVASISETSSTTRRTDLAPCGFPDPSSFETPTLCQRMEEFNQFALIIKETV